MARKSRILREVLETARDLRNAGLIDAGTMRKFQALCRRQVPHKSHDAGSKRVR